MVPLEIDRADVRLLLDILESRAATISGAALADYFARQSARLMAANLLEPRGDVLAAPSLTDHEDEPVTLSWSAQHGGYGYFSPTAGWVVVPAERLAVLGVNIPAVLSTMLVQFDLTSRGGPQELVSNQLWELGDARVGRARGRLPIWFCRCIYDSAVWQHVVDAAARRPSERIRILLTSTPGRRAAGRALPGHLLVAVEDVLDHNEPLSISPSIVVARLEGTAPPAIEGRLWLSPDGQTLTIDGNAVLSFRADTQIKIIRKLVAGYREGKRFRFSELRGSAPVGAKALRQVFGTKKWAVLSRYLKVEGDLWGFEL